MGPTGAEQVGGSGLAERMKRVPELQEVAAVLGVGETVGAGQLLPGATASSVYWAGKCRPTFGLLSRAAADRLRSAARARAVSAAF